MSRMRRLLIAIATVAAMCVFPAQALAYSWDSYGSGDTDISTGYITIPQSSYTYTGDYIRPEVTVHVGGKVLSDDDYFVYYSNNWDVGTATIEVEGRSWYGYTGTLTKTFEITPINFSKGTLQLSNSTYTYSGSACEPEVTLTVGGEVVSSWDYDVSYYNNVNAGTATVTVRPGTYSSEYTGSISKTFTIKPLKIGKCDLINPIYNGKKQLPSVYATVPEYYADDETYYNTYKELRRGTDYTIKTSKKHKKVGKYKATIKFKGNYTGTVKKSFKILPGAPIVKKTKALSKTKIAVRWNKVKGATGYKVYRWNTKKSKYTLYCTTSKTHCSIKRSGKYDQEVSFKVSAYTKVGKKNYLSDGSGWGSQYLKLSKPVFSLKRTDFGRFEVRFKAYGQYQVQIASSKAFKNTSNNFCKVWKGYTDCVEGSNYDSGRKLYVRARAYYYTDSGSLKVGPWSAIKTVTPY